MNKSRIWYSASSHYWNLNLEGKTDIPCSTFKAAWEYLHKRINREIRQQKAFARIANQLDVELLTVTEARLIKKLIKTKCDGITKKQYGWLVGICERQKEN